VITIKTEEEISKIRIAGRIIAEFLKEVEKILKPDLDSYEIELFAIEFVRKRGGELAFKNYKGFPGYIAFLLMMKLFMEFQEKVKNYQRMDL